jgi:hypothetical protein
MATIYDNMYVYRPRQVLRNIMKENILKKISGKSPDGFESAQYKTFVRLFQNYDFKFTELLNILRVISPEVDTTEPEEQDPGYTEEVEECNG